MTAPSHGLQLTSTITAASELELTLAEVPVPTPGPEEVVIQVEASPINPSDLSVLLGHADPGAARYEGTADRPKVVIKLSPEGFKGVSGRVGLAMPVGLEGAGVVVAAGEAAKGLVGKRVAALLGAMHTQYRVAPAAACVVLPERVSSADGASLFVNPLTALAMVETARQENHTGLIHTAAASNLGQMLVKICVQDRVPLVNIVRRPQHVELLRGLGATHVCDSSAPSFKEDLVAALKATGATLAFDAIGGGPMAGDILASVEAAAVSRMTEYAPYGSAVPKQVYIYGLLDERPTVLDRNYGMIWGIGGWAMPMILERAGQERADQLRKRVLDDIKTTFASHYVREISLAEALQRDVLTAYAKQATGEKYLINPSR
jgi:NADPH:quinone reductase-like Zn-dependent oxidoreductase